jgi:hypothetical protein
MNGDLRRAITTKRAHLVRDAAAAARDGNFARKSDLQMRIRFLLGLQERLQNDARVAERPKLFISFSTKSGAGYYKKASQHASAYGFDVHDGFKRTDDTNVLKAVRNSISEAAAFLAIMTPELKIQGKRQGGKDPVRFAPSVWIVEEKGMALALNKPFRMLVHRSVHEDFWMRTTPGSLHHVFEERTFEEKLTEAMTALQRRHEELQLASIGLPMPDRD